MEEKTKSGFSTAGLVLSIIGVCTSFIPIINNLSFVMAIIAIIFAVIALLKKSGKGKIIATIILAILAIVITLNSQKAVGEALETMGNEISNSLDTATGANTEEVLKNDLDVTLGKFKVKKDEYTTDTELSVKVKNKSSETSSFSVTIEAVDKNGNRIEEDTVYFESLKAGQGKTENAFTLATSDMIKKLKNAEFKILEVSKY